MGNGKIGLVSPLKMLLLLVLYYTKLKKNDRPEKEFSGLYYLTLFSNPHIQQNCIIYQTQKI